MQFQRELEREERRRLKVEEDRLKSEATLELQKEESKLKSLIEKQEDIADKARIKLRKLSKGWQY
jgi:hypothetical protein